MLRTNNNPNTHKILIEIISERYNITNLKGVCHGVALMSIVTHSLRNRGEFNRLIQRTSKLAEKRHGNFKEPTSKRRASSTEHDSDALLDGIAICQGSLSQHQTSVQLLQIRSEQNIGIISPKALENKGGIKLIDHWLGCYDDNALNAYFKLITNHSKKINLSYSLLISSCHHSIALHYDHKYRRWYFTNANQLPVHPIKPDDLAARIKAALFETGESTIFNTEAYFIYNEQEKASAFIQNLKNAQSFQTLHQINSGNANIKSNNTTLTFIAASYNHYTTLNALLAAGANCNQARSDGATPLYVAAYNGDTNIVSLLLAAGANCSHATSDGATPLYVAAENGHTSIVSQLLPAGANSNQARSDGTTPLYIAAHKGYADIVNLLLAAGANSSQATSDGAIPLFIAAHKGYADIVSLLLAAGANCNQARSDGATPLFIAAENGHTNIVSLLLPAGANCNQARSDGTTPLFIAAHLGYADIVSQLLAAGANCSQATSDGTTPLLFAAHMGYADIVSQLLAAGANCNQARSDGTTPLFLAAQNGHTNIVSLLLAAGANCNQATSDGATPLFIAAHKRHADIVSLLLAAGANRNQKWNNLTPLMTAKAHGHHAIIQLLEQTNAISPNPGTFFFKRPTPTPTPDNTLMQSDHSLARRDRIKYYG